MEINVNAKNDSSVPENYVKSLFGKKVFIKLLDDSEYVGNLISLDGLLNIVLEQCEEVNSNKSLSCDKYEIKQSLKETYIRGNNILYITDL